MGVTENPWMDRARLVALEVLAKHADDVDRQGRALIEVPDLIRLHHVPGARAAVFEQVVEVVTALRRPEVESTHE